MRSQHHILSLSLPSCVISFVEEGKSPNLSVFVWFKESMMPGADILD